MDLQTTNVRTYVTKEGKAVTGEADDGLARASCPDATPVAAQSLVTGPWPCHRVCISRNVAEFFFIRSRNRWELNDTG